MAADSERVTSWLVKILSPVKASKNNTVLIYDICIKIKRKCDVHFVSYANVLVD